SPVILFVIEDHHSFRKAQRASTAIFCRPGEFLCGDPAKLVFKNRIIQIISIRITKMIDN
ncbi:MAG: hypothetical protein II799_02925, partial [Lachnospiraceae bacterium]|nr:hypothetical protein [Lachnospiraceae bacterium]